MNANLDLLRFLGDAVQNGRDLGEIYERALDAVTQGLVCDRASILVFDDRRRMRFRASRGLSEEYRQAVDGHSPWTADSLEPAPELVEDANHDSAWSAYQALFRAEHIGALAFFPLLWRGRLLGKLTVYFAEPRALSAEELRWALLVTQQVAMALSLQRTELESLRALEETRQARQTAEGAARNRNHLLALVAHDLRNPINTLKLSVALLSRTPAYQSDEKLLRQLDRMGRSTASMEQFLDCLTDVVSVQNGLMRVELDSEELTSIVQQSVDAIAPRAAERCQALTVDVPMGIRVRGDRHRLKQALTYVVADSIHATPTRGWIRLTGRKVTNPNGAMVELAIADSGPAIAAQDSSVIFEEPWSLPRSARSGRIGLVVAKGIVDAHGGSLSVEPAAGTGTVFRFMLPVAE